MKRAFDLCVSLAALLLLLPIFVAISLMVYWHIGSPIFFRQSRPGLRGREFIMYKFRTMSNERDSAGALLPDVERLG